MTNQKIPRAATTTLPGFRYIERMTSVFTGAILAQAKAGESAWQELKEGKFELKSLGKLYANSVERYYGFVCDALRTDTSDAHPVWLLFPFSKANQAVVERSATLDRSEPEGTTASGTPFTSMTGKGGAFALVENAEISNGRTLLVKLNKAAVAQLENDQYIGFIFADGQGAGTPLAVVVLSVGP